MSKLFQHLNNLFRKSSSLIYYEQRRDFNANRAVVTRIKRTHFTQMYPVQLIKPDGSTLSIKYSVPRLMIKLPVQFETLSAEMQRKVKLARLPKDTKKKKQRVSLKFDPLKYAKK